MECGPRTLTISSLLVLILTLESYFIGQVHSKTIVTSLPGYFGQLPFTLETGYVGIGEKEETQFFYYFVESERKPEEDPLVFHLPGGPGTSAIFTLLYQIGPLSYNFNNDFDNITMRLNPNSWTKMANVIFVDLPVGTGFSYATTKEASISSDTLMVKQAHEFLRKFLIDHPKFLKNPLYISATSYMGIVTPILTLDVYNANERNAQPTLNIQGCILIGPLTDKANDFNFRLEYAHRMGLISDDIYKSAIENCHGNFVNDETSNLNCRNILQRYDECTSRINIKHILEPLCDDTDLKPDCQDYYNAMGEIWGNDKVVQQALNVREGTIEKMLIMNMSLHYAQGKNDTSNYAYNIFSSFPYHKKLVRKNCRVLIYSGDHEMTFPYIGIQKWIESLNVPVKSPWEAFYVNNQVGGYEVTYAQNDYSMTFATIKGAGHSVALYKPEEAMVLTQRWLDSKTHSSAM